MTKIDENYGLIKTRALSFYQKGKGYSLADLESIAVEGMLHAIKHFNQDKAKFSTFATICMNQHIIKYLKTHKQLKTISNEYIDLSQSTDKESIEEYIPESCTDKEKQILRMLAAGHSRKEVAEEVGINYSTLNNRIGKLFSKVKRAND